MAAAAQDQKLGWSGHVVSIDLAGDSDSSSSDDDDDGIFHQYGIRKHRRNKRKRQRHQPDSSFARGVLDTAAIDPDAHKGAMGVARMPSRQGYSDAVQVSNDVIVLEDVDSLQQSVKSNSPTRTGTSRKRRHSKNNRKRKDPPPLLHNNDVVMITENAKATRIVGSSRVISTVIANNKRVATVSIGGSLDEAPNHAYKDYYSNGSNIKAQSSDEDVIAVIDETPQKTKALAGKEVSVPSQNDEVVVCEPPKLDGSSPTERVLKAFPTVDVARAQNLLLHHGMAAADLDRTAMEDSQNVIIQAVLAELLATTTNDEDDDIIEVCESRKANEKDVIEVVSVKITPLQRILEVFPDVDISHAETLLTQEGITETRQPVQPQHEPLLQMVLSKLAESSYPKNKNTASNGMAAHNGTLVQRTGALKTYRHDYMSPSCFEPTTEYIRQACLLLKSDFSFLAKRSIKKRLAACQQHYAICHDSVIKVLWKKKDDDEFDEQQYLVLKRALEGHKVPLRVEQLLLELPGVTSVLKRPRQQTPICVTDPILKDEVAYVRQKNKVLMDELNTKALRCKARRESERVGSTMECLCCFAHVAMDEMISCKEEGHLFCVDCLRRFAEEQVFGQGNLGIDKSANSPALELKCIAGQGCTSGFDPDHLRKALPVKVLAKYEELQFCAAVEKAGVQDMCTCPKCGYQAVLPETEMIFRCPVADCLYESCRKCGEEPHIPLRCEEVEKKNETKGRLKVEEAISAAKIRTCPRPGCGKKFVKESGCNKMTCACGTWVCYVCRAAIPKNVGYQHFCQTAHCQHQSCNKCPLYTKGEEDDARAMREAGIKAAEEVREESLLQGEEPAQTGTAKNPPTAAEVRINVDSLLENPNVPQTARPPPVPAMLPVAMRPSRRLPRRAQRVVNLYPQNQERAAMAMRIPRVHRPRR